jgi:hypothetical protein
MYLAIILKSFYRLNVEILAEFVFRLFYPFWSSFFKKAEKKCRQRKPFKLKIQFSLCGLY